MQKLLQHPAPTPPLYLSLDKNLSAHTDTCACVRNKENVCVSINTHTHTHTHTLSLSLSLARARALSLLCMCTQVYMYCVHTLLTFGVSSQRISRYSQWMANIGALLFDRGSQLEKNSFGGTCYYGEYPLSFAAAVGDVHICHMIERKAQDLLLEGLQELHDGSHGVHGEATVSYATQFLAGLYLDLGEQDLGEQVDNENEDVAQNDAPKKDLNVHAEVQRLKYVFMNRCDARGNTALHLAVMHQKKNVIDWLLQNGAKPSLRTLNQDHLTPLTLAVRMGNAEVFQHIVSNLEINVWTMGSARMLVTPLEQIDTFRIASKEDAERWKIKEKNQSKQILSKINAATTAAASTTLDAAKASTLGVVRMATNTANGVTRGFQAAIHVGKDPAKAMVDLRAHKALFSTLKSRLENTTVVLSTLVQSGVKLFSKKPPGHVSESAHDLHSNDKFRSALQIVVENEIDAFFDVPLFRFLVNDKWEVSTTMCVYVCMCVSSNARTQARTHARTHVRARMYVHANTRPHAHTRTYTRALSHTLTHTHALTHAHTHTHARMRARTHTL